jgi:hypothetical protein
MEVLIGNVNYREVGLNKALLQYKALSLIGREDNLYVAMLEDFLTSHAPDKIELYGNTDFTLGHTEQFKLRKALNDVLIDLIKNKKEYPEGTFGDFKKILGKNIRIHLKDRDDIVINTFYRLYEIAEDCLHDKKLLYFSVIEK